MHAVVRRLDESQASLESFHDCHVHGLRWRRDHFSFSMDIQYILEWIDPAEPGSGYQFSVCEARLSFRNANELRILMDWSDSALDAQVATIRISKSRSTPNGLIERYFEVDFSDPEAKISLWSTGYEVLLLEDPVISSVTSIPVSND